MSWPSYLHDPERSADELDVLLMHALERAESLGYPKLTRSSLSASAPSSPSPSSPSH